MTEEAGEETAAVEASELPGKCTRQNVLIVVLKPKYLSNLTRKDPFTAENVFLSTGNPEKIDTKPEFHVGIAGNRRFSGSCTIGATARGPFRFAQADLHFYFLKYTSYPE